MWEGRSLCLPRVVCSRGLWNVCLDRLILSCSCTRYIDQSLRARPWLQSFPRILRSLLRLSSPFLVLLTWLSLISFENCIYSTSWTRIRGIIEDCPCHLKGVLKQCIWSHFSAQVEKTADDTQSQVYIWAWNSWRWCKTAVFSGSGSLSKLNDNLLNTVDGNQLRKEILLYCTHLITSDLDAPRRTSVLSLCRVRKSWIIRLLVCLTRLNKLRRSSVDFSVCLHSPTSSLWFLKSWDLFFQDQGVS